MKDWSADFWETDSGIVEKQYYSNDASTRTLYTGLNNLDVQPTDTIVNISNYFVTTYANEIGYLDFEWLTVPNQNVKLVIEDSDTDTLYDSGWQASATALGSKAYPPNVIAGWPDSTGRDSTFNPPFKITVQTDTLVDFNLYRLDMYKGVKMPWNYSNASIAKVADSTYLGFPVDTLTGVNNSSARFAIDQNTNYRLNHVKVGGYVKHDTTHK